jgi:hypothetical protein
VYKIVFIAKMPCSHPDNDILFGIYAPGLLEPLKFFSVIYKTMKELKSLM